LNSIAETYTFEINGDPTGSYGDSAYFQGKVLVLNSVTGASFHDLVMTNDHGKPVSAGVYLYKIQAGEFIQTKKMVLLK